MLILSFYTHSFCEGKNVGTKGRKRKLELNDLKEIVVNRSYKFIKNLKGDKTSEIVIRGFYARNIK